MSGIIRHHMCNGASDRALVRHRPPWYDCNGRLTSMADGRPLACPMAWRLSASPEPERSGPRTRSQGRTGCLAVCMVYVDAGGLEHRAACPRAAARGNGRHHREASARGGLNERPLHVLNHGSSDGGAGGASVDERGRTLYAWSLIGRVSALREGIRLTACVSAGMRCACRLGE